MRETGDVSSMSQEQALAAYRPLCDAVVAAVDTAAGGLDWRDPVTRAWRSPDGDCFHELHRFATPFPPVSDLSGLVDDVNHQLRAHAFAARRHPERDLGGVVIESRDLAGARFLLLLADRVELALRVPAPADTCGGPR